MRLVQIYLWRHGEAEKGSPTGRDEDRTLSPEGRNDLIEVADFAFARRGLKKPQKIFTSPYPRAKESAEMIQGFLACSQGLEVLPQLKSGTALEDLISALRVPARSLNSFILFGHMPDLGHLADRLLGQARSVQTPLKAGGLLQIELQSFEEPFKGELLLSLNPQDVSG